MGGTSKCCIAAFSSVGVSAFYLTRLEWIESRSSLFVTSYLTKFLYNTQLSYSQSQISQWFPSGLLKRESDLIFVYS